MVPCVAAVEPRDGRATRRWFEAYVFLVGPAGRVGAVRLGCEVQTSLPVVSWCGWSPRRSRAAHPRSPDGVRDVKRSSGRSVLPGRSASASSGASVI